MAVLAASKVSNEIKTVPPVPDILASPSSDKIS